MAARAAGFSAAIIVGALFSQPVTAEIANSMIYGTKLCEDWTNNPDKKAEYFQFVPKFLGQLVALMPQNLEPALADMTNGQALALIDEICKRAPTKFLYEAVVSLVIRIEDEAKTKSK